MQAMKYQQNEFNYNSKWIRFAHSSFSITNSSIYIIQMYTFELCVCEECSVCISFGYWFIKYFVAFPLPRLISLLYCVFFGLLVCIFCSICAPQTIFRSKNKLFASFKLHSGVISAFAPFVRIMSNNRIQFISQTNK